ncbi:MULTISPECIES: DUF692 family multinuclear iron-containing protein [Bradyrhizobium]|uniref:multinuclear nonheme iron-dependent oxidase n=1 Tax=Bradyrhizobium TaxID=374 RepID=UPI001BA4E30F|nr:MULTISPECIES: DUF692 family multinuclear iron-containing protein [Bradyrhizobium]MBR1033796.1 DUF692 family protein [Bradyrhizobium liaoningense]MCP1774906.1 uncharacterized protein (UPF0276 family) [Bradyrhizobium japonicum]MCP1962094.1 uncharacterized protein (UPF0276 family) [Bradyrhizobium japonicum]
METEYRKVLLGARWDEPSQNKRIIAAHSAGLLDYAEVNYPVMPGAEPSLGQIPIFVHCPVNPLASPYGYNRKLAELIRREGERHRSPWIGEHLCWAGEGDEGRLGYIVTPPVAEATVQVAVENVAKLQAYYGRSIALELAPIYSLAGELSSEMEFLGMVAEGANSLVLLDVAHWTASNRNLGRSIDFGLDKISPARIVEIHVAGIRRSRSGPFWHDSHADVPEKAILELATDLIRTLPMLRAVTFEHAESAPEDTFISTLEVLKHIVAAAK